MVRVGTAARLEGVAQGVYVLAPMALGVHTTRPGAAPQWINANRMGAAVVLDLRPVVTAPAALPQTSHKDSLAIVAVQTFRAVAAHLVLVPRVSTKLSAIKVANVEYLFPRSLPRGPPMISHGTMGSTQDAMSLRSSCNQCRASSARTFS